MKEDLPTQRIDAAGWSSAELLAKLQGFQEGDRVNVQLEGQKALSGICAGIDQALTVKVEGAVGNFACLLASQATIDISGDVGDGFAHSLISGHANARGSAGDFLAAYAGGGFVSVLGRAGFRCALGLNGGDVFVRSSVGDQAGCSMRQGTLVLGNGAGEQLGAGMLGGTIYVRGEVKSLWAGLRNIRMKDPDFLRLSLLLARAGIKSDGRDFKAYAPKAAK